MPRSSWIKGAKNNSDEIYRYIQIPSFYYYKVEAFCHFIASLEIKSLTIQSYRHWKNPPLCVIQFRRSCSLVSFNTFHSASKKAFILNMCQINVIALLLSLQSYCWFLPMTIRNHTATTHATRSIAVSYIGLTCTNVGENTRPIVAMQLILAKYINWKANSFSTWKDRGIMLVIQVFIASSIMQRIMACTNTIIALKQQFNTNAPRRGRWRALHDIFVFSLVSCEPSTFVNQESDIEDIVKFLFKRVLIGNVVRENDIHWIANVANCKLGVICKEANCTVLARDISFSTFKYDNMSRV